MVDVLAFIVAMGILISVHEFGHYQVARWCGVKVLRFSIGFGKPLISRHFGSDRTEWALAAFPLGGYVKMLDEREAPVEPHEQHRAFNRQHVAKRIAITAAGPLANLILAVVLYTGIYMYGVEELRPLFGKPVADSLAARAGIEDGELVTAVDGEKVDTLQQFSLLVIKHALDKATMRLETINRNREINERKLDLSGVSTDNLERDMLKELGFRLWRPFAPPEVKQVVADSPAAAAGFRPGDRALAVGDKRIGSAAEFSDVITASGTGELTVHVERDGQPLDIPVTPHITKEKGREVARIGVALVDADFDRSVFRIKVRYGPLEALGKGFDKTWDTSLFTLQIFGKMIAGEVSLKNLSGPVTIAVVAGESAKRGLLDFLTIVALISISIGVLNLLPVPILDGGHLMYYIVEIIKGGPVSEKAMEIGQQIGLALLVMLMAFAFYNDITRHVSG